MLSCLAVPHGLHRLDVHGAYSCGPTGIARKPDLRVSEPRGKDYLSAEAIENRVRVLGKKCDSCGVENREEANYCLTCGRSFFMRLGSIAVGPMKPSVALAPSSCLFHPVTASQFSCASCGVPLCFACVRWYFQSAHCPICFARASTLRQLGIGSTIRRPRIPLYFYGRRLTR